MQRKFFKFIKAKPKATLQNLRPVVYVPIKLPPKTYTSPAEAIYNVVRIKNAVAHSKTKYASFLEVLLKRYSFLESFINAIKEEKRYGAFFLIASLLSVVGAVIYFWLDYEIAIKSILAVAGIALSLAYLSRRLKPVASIFLLLLALLTGVAAAKLEDLRYSTKMLPKDTVTYIKAKVLFLEQQKAHKYRLLLKLLDTQHPHLDGAPDIIRLSARIIPNDLGVGDNIEGRVFLRALSGPVRPDNYDFAFYNYFQGIGAQGFFLRAPQLYATNDKFDIITTISLKISRLRFALLQRIKQHDGSENGAIAAALIAGTHGGISQETNNALRIAGLAHVLAISGLHMSMITGIVFFTIRGILSLFMSFASYFSIKKISACVALVAASCYFLLSGSSPSAQRSFIMASIIFLAIILDRRAITLHNLSLAIWVAVLIYPHQILDPSFQMSFSAAGALIAAYGFYTRWKSEEGLGHIPGPQIGSVWLAGFMYIKNMWQALFAAATSSLVAGAASGIFAAYHFGNTAPFGVISNALIFPVITFIIMPFAVIAVLAMLFHLEAGPIFIMCKGIVLLKYIAFWVVSFSPHIQVKYISSLTLAVLSLGFCLLIILRTKLRLIGFFIMLLGALMYYLEPIPIALISENGKMVAAINKDRSLALAYKRPSNFTLTNWQKAFGIEHILLPVSDAESHSRLQFICNADVCSHRLVNGEMLYVAANERGKNLALQAQAASKIIFLNYKNYDMPQTEISNNYHMLIIKKENLAARGALEIFADHKLAWAINHPVRSWNAYRISSARD
ncbi:ComEC/Rec2 family competence protein [Bartonella sp. TP]|uniref:ComEC/Rec2 family competence protein n=1 Tax=Bartonella sp. TP TaxID=3057550 RepID=UPI0025B134EB|nr:ComEC/Rec2 family competence protein [Bartonella sp. TP]WJW79884.1 ComEC/Rec2 family competence protein [Bartonella sp. TP]